jgi:hypothetical protein
LIEIAADERFLLRTRPTLELAFSLNRHGQIGEWLVYAEAKPFDNLRAFDSGKNGLP